MGAIALLVLVATAGVPSGSADTVGAELNVGFVGDVDTNLLSLLNATLLRSIPEIDVAVVWVDDPETTTSLLLADPSVEFVELNERTLLAGSSWDGSSWDVSQWDVTSLDGAQWDVSQWDGLGYDVSQWDVSQWDVSQWDVSQWDVSQWDVSQWDVSQWDVSQWDWGTMDPGFSSQWGLGAVNATGAWAYTMGDRNVDVCVLDTGVDATHPDLRPSLWQSPDGRFGHNAMRGHESEDAWDDVGHGTFVAGIIGAVAANGTGVTGMAQETIMAVKVMDANGGKEDDLAAGLVWCATHGAEIASMSLHVTEDSRTLTRALAFASERGLLLVAAAGNAGATTLAYPASDPHVIAVGAVRADGAVANFSNTGDGLSLVAPGVHVVSTASGGTYASGSGTSAAAPFVAAAAALVWEENANLTAGEVRNLLESTARDVGAAGYDTASGHGALNAGRAVAAAHTASGTG